MSPTVEALPEVPQGMCGCGCGVPTRIANKTSRSDGQTKGEPLRFVHGHHNRLRLVRRDGPDYLVDERGCWVWQHCIQTGGYGWTSRAGRDVLAYVVYWEREHGSVPEGLELDHLCRNRACVNPDHLEPVTHAENCRRGARTKLNWEAVNAIRASSETQAVLAGRFGVSLGAIADIKTYRTWKAI